MARGVPRGAGAHSAATFTSVLPKFSPSSIPMKAEGAFSSPSVTLSGYIRDRRLKYRESVTEGLENAPATFLSMLKGGNFGKTLVKVAE